MKTPQRIGEEVAGMLAERMEKGIGLARQFAGVRDDVAAVIATERQRADPLAEALRCVTPLLCFVGNSVNADMWAIHQQCVAALAAYDTPTAAGGSGQSAASLTAQESPAGGDFPPTAGRAGD